MSFMVQAMIAAESKDGDPSIWDNEVLDQWRIPFGDWYEQAVNWVKNNQQTLLDILEWPFSVLINLINERFLLALPWLVVVIGFFFLGWLAQNIRVGLFAAGALTVCGLMGASYWEQTAKTIGFISVAVFFCVIIGVPVGVACGRTDALWNAFRPMLDAMQVVHSFVYMLPFIYFFGIGPVSATMVTMIFALPPLIRLTNLGIRQVPEDVVEASRAFGQSELKILRDVQLPLARPAIMTGINQTLLLSISMLGIAAIMGAGGLAKFMLNALNQQSPALSGSAGLSFFLVAVVLDRISQRGDGASGSLFERMMDAWRNAKTPENLLKDDSSTKVDQAVPAVVYQPVVAREMVAMGVAVIGAVITLISVFLVWNSGGGWFSSFTRKVDELGRNDSVSIEGESFNGLAASGGSWFGYMLIFFAVIVLASVVLVMLRPGVGPRWFNPDGVAIAGVAATILMASYLLSDISPEAIAVAGIGPWVGLAGSIVMAVGGLMWMHSADYMPLRPLPESRQLAPVVAGVLAMVIALGGAFSAWVYDERSDVTMDAELKAEIDELIAQAKATDDPKLQSTLTAQATVLRAQAEKADYLVRPGIGYEGPNMGIWTFVVSIIGFVAAVLAAVWVSAATRARWLAATLTLAAGMGLGAVFVGWVGTLARATDGKVVSGVGILMTLIAGAILVSIGRSITAEFHRSRKYEDLASLTKASAAV